MAIKNLEIFVSYYDTKQFETYLDENGTSELVEINGPIETDSGLSLKLGGVLRAVREFHADRLSETKLGPISYFYTSSGDMSVLDNESYWMGVLYFSEPKVGDFEIMPVDEFAYSGNGKVLVASWRKIEED